MAIDPREQVRAVAGVMLAGKSTVRAARWRNKDYRAARVHHEIGDVCDRSVRGALARQGIMALVSSPPRHGKTELVGRALPINGAIRAQAAGQDWPVLYATSAADRAEEVSWQVRAAAERIFRETGDPWWAPGAKWGILKFETEGGFAWNAVGVGSTTGGIGCRQLIMDDLIGSAAVYSSGAKRGAIVRAVEADLLSRLMKNGSAIHMETRRGTEDTTAYIAEHYGSVWEQHVWRCWEPERGYLWPEEFGEDWRARNPHLTDSSPVWRSLYQQEPIPEGGTLIEPEWLTATYSEPPAIAAKMCDRVALGVDLAASGKGDPCAIVVIGMRGAYRDLLWAGKRTIPYPEQRQWVTEAASEWGATEVHIELASGGHALESDLKSTVPGVQGHPPRGSKALRATPFLPLMAGGQLRLPREVQPWMREYRQDMTSVTGTGDEEDHYLDATVWALVGLHGKRRVRHSAWSRALRG